MRRKLPSSSSARWLDHYATDGRSLNLEALREARADYAERRHWYLWDLRKHWPVFVGLILGRAAALAWALWALLDYAQSAQVEHFVHMTLLDGVRLALMHPVPLVCLVGAFALRFRTITRYLRRRKPWL